MSTTLVKDLTTGAFVPSSIGRTMVDLNGGAPTASNAPNPKASDPYSLFNQNIANILSQIQQASAAGKANLGGARDYLTTESVAPNGPAPANPGVFSDSMVAGQKSLQNSFAPAITSVNTQLENTNSSLDSLKSDIGSLSTIFQPREVAPGTSLVTPGGTVVHEGHQYQPQMNPYTGLLDGFDINSGTWQSQDKGPVGAIMDSTVATSTGPVDFSGGANGVGNYAGTTKDDATNYAKAVGAIYTNLSTSMPQPTAPGIDAYIGGHAKSSPVTGQMILNAATQYGVDPNMLAAVLAQESDFGTAGVGAKTMNPGNVGNTGTSTKNYNSWQQGVSATAEQIARRQGSSQQGSQPQAPTSNVGGQFSSEAAQRITKMPGPMQSYVDAGPKGVAYINDDRVPSNLKDTIKTMASRAGIPYVGSGDASAIKSIGVVYQSLDGMKKLVADELHGGILGAAEDLIKTGLHHVTLGNAFPSLSKFNSYRDTAIKAVQGLAGGAGSGLRINAAEIEANLSNLPVSTDTIQNANQKLIGLTGLLDKQLAATFPYIASSSMAPSTSGSVRVKLQNGQIGSVSASEFNPSTMTKM